MGDLHRAAMSFRLGLIPSEIRFLPRFRFAGKRRLGRCASLAFAESGAVQLLVLFVEIVPSRYGGAFCLNG
jgi:hypothetical protein